MASYGDQKIEIKNMGWHSTEGSGEVLGGFGEKIPFLEIPQPFNITCTCSSCHSQNITVNGGKDELNLETI